jgi:hypothetical protein
MRRHDFDRYERVGEIIFALAVVVGLALLIGLALGVTFPWHGWHAWAPHKADLIEPLPPPVLTPPIKRTIIDAEAPATKAEATPPKSLMELGSRGILAHVKSRLRENREQRPYVAGVIGPGPGVVQPSRRQSHHAVGARESHARAGGACGVALDVAKITAKDWG